MAQDFWDAVDTFKTQKNGNPPPTRTIRADGKPQLHLVNHPYVETALQREAEAVTAAPKGERNQTLNDAALKLGGFVANGMLDETRVTDTLTAAALATPYPDGDSQHQIEATIRSGLRAGMMTPRPIPAPRNTPITTQSGTFTNPTEQQTQDLIQAEMNRLRITREARRLLNAEEATRNFTEPPNTHTLTEELLEPDEDVAYRVEDLIPVGGNVLLTAQYKTGKTTLINALTKSLADNTPFLGKYAPQPLQGRIAVFNYEVDARQYRRWMRDLNIRNTNNIAVLNLRGYRLPLISPQIEDWVVNWLTERETQIWILDPFARAYVGSGTDENNATEVGYFLDTLDVIKQRAGVQELILPTHTGRGEFEPGKERTRGSTRLDDWPDVRWLLTKDDDGTRYFSAMGRDVETEEAAIAFQEATRGLTITGGTRGQEHQKKLTNAVLACVNATPGIDTSQLRVAVKQILKKTSPQELTDELVKLRLAGVILTKESFSTPRHYPTRHQNTESFYKG